MTGGRQATTRGDSLLCSQLQFRVVAAERDAQCFDHKFVIGALGQTGDGYAAYHARARYSERKRAAVGSVVGERKAVFVVQRIVLRLQAQAY